MTARAPVRALGRIQRSWPLITMAILFTGATGSPGQTLPLKDRPAARSLVCADAAEAPVCGESTAEVRGLINAATRALSLGELAEARDLLDQALALDPCAAEAAYLQGRIVHQQEGPRAATPLFCRYIELSPYGTSAAEARTRLAEAVDAGAADEPRAAFADGVSRFRNGELEQAEELFTDIIDARPVPEAVYNRGVVRIARGRGAQAQADLRRYLQLRPSAEDRLDIEYALEQLARGRGGPSPAGALALGVLFPGAGQYYTGRIGLGLAVTGLVAGAAIAGLSYERTTVWCRTQSPSGDCPPDAIAGTETARPLLVPTVVAGVVVMLAGAVEATLHARHRRPPAAARLGAGASLQVDVAVRPAVGRGTEIRLLRLVH